MFFLFVDPQQTFCSTEANHATRPNKHDRTSRYAGRGTESMKGRQKPLSEFQLFESLREYYTQREYALLPQVANGTGFSANRHLDCIALGLWPSRGLHFHGFEIKSYRHDWLRELANPEKAEEHHQYCNYWWIVAADEKIVRESELPHGWGLYVHSAEGLGRKTAAKYREAKPVDLPFLAAILRKAQDVATPASALLKARTEGREQGKRDAELNVKEDLTELKRLRDRLKEFETATGLEISRWRPVKQLCRAINLVLNGTVEAEREELLGIANRIVHDLSACNHQPGMPQDASFARTQTGSGSPGNAEESAKKV